MSNSVVKLVFCVLSIALSTCLSADDTRGVEDKKPAEGPYVAVDGKYMVPYSQKIPGSDVMFEMIPIPGGTFRMGSPADEDGREEEEGPQIEVVVEPFWMGKHEVTWSEYQQFMQLHDTFLDFVLDNERPVERESIDALTAPSNLYEPDFTYAFGDQPRQPAITMSQFAAKQYTKWISITCDNFFRLPSEAEWEYACRAGTTTAYSFGDDPSELGDYAWFEGNSDEQTQTVGTKKPNPFGLHDMHGNAAEWTLDQFTEDGYEGLEGKKHKALETVTWPTEMYGRVLRGGSWEMLPEQCRSAFRIVTEKEWKEDDPNIPQSPYWYSTRPGTSIGMRIMRPFNAPESRAEKEKFWKAHVEEVWEIVLERNETDGKGQFGLLDKDLPAAVTKANE